MITRVEQERLEHAEGRFRQLEASTTARFQTQDSIIELMSCEIARDSKKKSDILLELDLMKGEFKRSKLEVDTTASDVQRRLEDLQQELQHELARLSLRTGDAEEKLTAYDAELARIRNKLDLEPGALLQAIMASNLSSHDSAPTKQDIEKVLQLGLHRLAAQGGGSGGHHPPSSLTSRADRRPSSNANESKHGGQAEWKDGQRKLAASRAGASAQGHGQAEKQIIFSKNNLQSIKESKFDYQETEGQARDDSFN